MITETLATAGLSTYACIALILFLTVFAAVLWRVFSHRHDAEWRQASQLPLSDGSHHMDHPPGPKTGESGERP